jgi:hypothetical protein
MTWLVRVDNLLLGQVAEDGEGEGVKTLLGDDVKTHWLLSLFFCYVRYLTAHKYPSQV